MRSDSKLVVVTPWYPTAEHPYGGSFVQQWIRALDHPAELTTIVHLEAHALLTERSSSTTNTPLGTLERLTIPLRERINRNDVVAMTRAAVQEDLPHVFEGADVVHAHVGIPAAAAIAPLVPADVPLVVIEHASYLARMLAGPQTRVTYRSALARASHLLTVGELEARRVRRTFPSLAGRVTAVGNPIDASAFPPRSTPVTALNKWLYVGNMIPTKGVPEVLDSFAAWRRAEPARDSTLTLVGQGVHLPALKAQARKLGVERDATFVPSLPHDQLASVFEAADLLIHLSHGETFGLTAIEAVITGTPVVMSRCGGPEETLRYAASAGLARFVDRRPSPKDVVKAVRALERELPYARPVQVRDQLLHRYGLEDFGERVRRHTPPHSDARSEDNPTKALVIASGPTGAREAMHICQTLLRAGAEVRYVTTSADDAVETDRRVTVHSLAPRTRRSVLRATERLVFRTLPVGALRVVRLAFRLLTKVGGLVGRISSRFYWLADRAVNKASSIADRIHARFFDRFIYQSTSGRPFANYALKEWPELISDAPDLVMWCDPKSQYLAWRIARELPDAQVIARPTEHVLDELLHDRSPQLTS